MKILRMLWDDFSRRVIHDKRGTWGVVGVSLAVATGAASAYGASKQAKATEKASEAQLEAQQATLAQQTELAEPKMAYEQEQLKLFQELFAPLLKQAGGTVQAGLEDPSTLQSPLQKQLTETVSGQLDQPLSLPQETWDQIFQKGRERIGSEFEALTQKTSERLAGGGPGKLRGGPAQSMFADIEKERVQSIEDFAIDQSIAEWNEKKQAQQQAITNAAAIAPQSDLQQKALQNVFSFTGQSTPSVGQAQIPTTVPSSYVPEASSGIGTGIETALKLYDVFKPQPTTPAALPASYNQPGSVPGYNTTVPIGYTIDPSGMVVRA